MNGHQSGGGTMDKETVNGLAAVWQRYFPGEEFSVSDPNVLVAAELKESFSTVAKHLLSPVEDDGSGVIALPIDFQQLQKSCKFTKTKFLESPKEALLCMGAAAHVVMYMRKDFQLDDIKEIKINIRLYNYSEKINPLKELKSAYIKKIVTVRGTVLKVSTVKPLVLQLNFRCIKCAVGITRTFCDGKFSPPTSCSMPGCKSRTFIPDRSTANLIDFQKIRIQELASADNHEEGRVPRTVECELTEDLVDCCIPGEIVTITGIVKVLNTFMDVGGGKSKSRNQGVYYLYLEAISVRNLKSRAASDEEIQASGIFDFQTCTEKDIDFAVKYKEQHGSDVFRQILQSFCPSIYGHELVKVCAKANQGGRKTGAWQGQKV